MGWEWRLFFVGDLRPQFADLIAANYPDLDEKAPAEERTDIYVSLNDAVGAKARGGEGDGEMEIKTRSDRKKRGAEMWKKERVQRPTSEDHSAQGQVLKDAKALIDKSEWDEETAMEVKLFKSRTLYKASDVEHKGVHAECTLIRVEPEGKEYTSVCFEHKKDPKKIYDAIELLKIQDFNVESRISSVDITGDDWMAKAVVGYPEFVMYVARERLAAR